MNTTTSSHHIIHTLNFIKHDILIYLPLIFIIVGIIGFIGNLFTFLQPILRLNTCCIYLLCGSLVDVTNLFVNLFHVYRTPKNENILSLITSSYVCKLKLFGLVFLPQLSINFLIVSLIDRYACTCSMTSCISQIRRLVVVPFIICITIIISGIMSLYSPMYYDFKPSFGCTCTDPFRNGILYIFIHGFITPFVMLIFVLLTYRNVLASRRRAGSKNLTKITGSKSPFLRMIFTHVFTTSFLTLQWISFYMYHIYIKDQLKTNEEITIHYFIWFISNNIYYLINVKSFYLSTLTSRSFRKTFFNSLFELLPYYQKRKKKKQLLLNPINIPSRNKSNDIAQSDF
ncbi:unnamed protein product [Adineta steineri]|uniref:G-protein coupled receptors family 1 profile domain-containing protein n=1 Tax=Adineta steineri TaxID=433720 RepID=A0A813WVJ5_9BILA|nr:unnamed protein product [Adineta steineri]CAF0947881.1 unnamed protein product [Adineta steineri]